MVEGALDAFELNGSWADVGWQLAGGLVPLALYLFIFFGRRFSRSGKSPLAFSMIGAMTLACAGLLPAALLSAQMASTRVSATVFVDLAEAYSIRHALDVVCRRQRDADDAGLRAISEKRLRDSVRWQRMTMAGLVDVPLKGDSAIPCDARPVSLGTEKRAKLRAMYLKQYSSLLAGAVFLAWPLFIGVLIMSLRLSTKERVEGAFNPRGGTQ